MKALGLMVTDKMSFKGYPYIRLCKTNDHPWGWGQFSPKGHNLNIFDKEPPDTATNQI